MTNKTDRTERVSVFLRVRLPVRCQEKVDSYFVAVTGPGLQLGFWDYKRAPRMTCSKDGVWIKHLWIWINSTLTYNYILVDSYTNKTIEIEKLNQRNVAIKAEPCTIDDIYNISDSPLSQKNRDKSSNTKSQAKVDSINHGSRTARMVMFKSGGDDNRQKKQLNDKTVEETIEDTQESNRIVPRFLYSETDSLYPNRQDRIRRKREERNCNNAQGTEEPDHRGENNQIKHKATEPTQRVEVKENEETIGATITETVDKVTQAEESDKRVEVKENKDAIYAKCPEAVDNVEQAEENDKHVDDKEKEETIHANCSEAVDIVEQVDESDQLDLSKHSWYMACIRDVFKFGLTAAAATYVASVIFRRIQS